MQQRLVVVEEVSHKEFTDTRNGDFGKSSTFTFHLLAGSLDS